MIVTPVTKIIVMTLTIVIIEIVVTIRMTIVTVIIIIGVIVVRVAITIISVVIVIDVVLVMSGRGNSGNSARELNYSMNGNQSPNCHNGSHCSQVP